MALKKKSLLFVVQEHRAKKPHYDFRLSNGKVLKSWVVPKNLPKNTNVKRLAIRVEDHKHSYADFEGEIPKGQYGAGRVLTYDRGYYCNLTENDKGEAISFSTALKKGHIKLELKGERFKGRYALIRIESKQWLIIKLKKK